jgi:hypothetical protein
MRSHGATSRGTRTMAKPFVQGAPCLEVEAGRRSAARARSCVSVLPQYGNCMFMSIRRGKISKHDGQVWFHKVVGHTAPSLFSSHIVFHIMMRQPDRNPCGKGPATQSLAKFNQSVTPNNGTKSKQPVGSHLTLWAIGRVRVKRHAMPSRRARAGVATHSAWEAQLCARSSSR